MNSITRNDKFTSWILHCKLFDAIGFTQILLLGMLNVQVRFCTMDFFDWKILMYVYAADHLSPVAMFYNSDCSFAA